MTIINDNGITIPTLAEKLEAIRTRYKSAYGDNVRVDDVDGVVGRHAGVLSETFHDLLTELAATVSGLLPSTSTGTLLEELVKFNGITRNVATKSTATVTVYSNAAGCTIPEGSIVATAEGIQFETDSEVILGASTDDDVTVTAIDEGAQEAAADTITEILTPVLGWASVNNDAAATAGNARETDPQLRTRRWEAAVGVGLHSPSAIKKALADLDDVTKVAVEVNNGTTTNANGVPPQHVRAIVKGGADQDIADSLFGPGAGSVGAGIGTYGSESAVSTDVDSGQSGTVYWERSVDVPIYITVRTYKIPREYPANGDDLMKDAILDFFAGDLEINDVSVDPFDLGDDVVSSRLYTPCNAISGHWVRSVLISKTESPTSSTDLSIATNEIAVTDADKIVIQGVS